MEYRLFVEQRKTSPKYFTSDTIRSFQYLQDLANLTRVNLDTWDLDLFRDETDLLGYSFISDKLKINEVFFAEVERRSKDPQLPVEVVKTIPAVDSEKYRKEVLEQAEVAARKTAKAHEQQAVNYQQSCDLELSRAIQNFNKADQLAGTAKDISARLNEILTIGPWEYSRINGAAICFRPVADIWLNYRNAETKEHYRVNFGKLDVQLHPSTGKVIVYADRDGKSPNVAGYWHPHINGSGNVCLGDAAAAFTRAMARMEFKQAFGMLFDLLTHYNPGSPYVELKRFQAVQPDNKPGFVARLCETCSGDLDLGRCSCCTLCLLSSNNCECWCCEICEETFKKDEDRCDCCQSCMYRECVCCSICGEPPEDEELRCECCTHCEKKSCECPQCPGLKRDGTPCLRKVTKCGSICNSCKEHHTSPDGYCQKCEPEYWAAEQERGRVNGERQRQEEQAQMARQPEPVAFEERIRGTFWDPGEPVPPESTTVRAETISFNSNDIPF